MLAGREKAAIAAVPARPRPGRSPTIPAARSASAALIRRAVTWAAPTAGAGSRKPHVTELTSLREGPAADQTRPPGPPAGPLSFPNPGTRPVSGSPGSPQNEPTGVNHGG